MFVHIKQSLFYENYENSKCLTLFDTFLKTLSPLNKRRGGGVEGFTGVLLLGILSEFTGFSKEKV